MAIWKKKYIFFSCEALSDRKINPNSLKESTTKNERKALLSESFFFSDARFGHQSRCCCCCCKEFFNPFFFFHFWRVTLRSTQCHHHHNRWSLMILLFFKAKQSESLIKSSNFYWLVLRQCVCNPIVCKFNQKTICLFVFGFFHLIQSFSDSFFFDKIELGHHHYHWDDKIFGPLSLSLPQTKQKFKILNQCQLFMLNTQGYLLW